MAQWLTLDRRGQGSFQKKLRKMEHKMLLVGLLIMTSLGAMAQSSTYEEVIREAERYESREQFGKAFSKYIAAKAIAPAKMDSVNQGIRELIVKEEQTIAGLKLELAFWNFKGGEFDRAAELVNSVATPRAEQGWEEGDGEAEFLKVLELKAKDFQCWDGKIELLLTKEPEKESQG